MLSEFLDVEITHMVFYDCNPRLSGDEAMSLINSMAKLLGQDPTNVHVGIAGKERRPLFKSALKQADEGKLDGYSYLQAVRYVEKGDVNSLELSIGSSYGEIWRGSFESTFEIGFIERQDQRVDPRNIIRLLSAYQKPGTGIYYRMPFKWGSWWFGTTVINLGLPEILQNRQREFVEEYREGRQREGKIRDIFEYNVLTNIHLEAWIEGERLRNWIEYGTKDSIIELFGHTRGSLEEVVEGVWLWTLTDKEIQLVRPLMLEAGLLMVKA